MSLGASLAQDRCQAEDPALTTGSGAEAGDGDPGAHGAACHFAWAPPTITGGTGSGEAGRGVAG